LYKINHEYKPTDTCHEGCFERLVSKYMSYAIEAQNLAVAFADLRAVDNVDFHVAYGEVVSLL